MTTLPLSAWRALHSFAVEAALHSYDEDPELSSFLMFERVGTSLDSFGDHLLRGDLTLNVLIGRDGDDAVFVRVLARGDDDQMVGLVHPRACELGVDEAELAVLVRADAAARGIEPEAIAWPFPADEDQT